MSDTFQGFDGGSAATARIAGERRVTAPVFPEIRRRERISMRDPQQPGLYVVDDEVVLPTPAELHAEASVEVEQILAEARQTAAMMVDQARLSRDAELEAARREGYEIGLAQGTEDGLDAADRESAALVATAEQIAMQVAGERTHLAEHAEGEVIELALQIAQRVVNAAIEVDPELVVEVCRGAMRKAFQRESLTVLAHPDDLTVLRAAGPRMAEELGGIKHLDFIEERRLTPGSVIVRTPAGEIDASLDAKFERIAGSLRESVEERRVARRSAEA